MIIWGFAGYANIVLKRDLERLLSTQQFSAVSVIAAGIDQEIRLRLRMLGDLAQLIGKRNLSDKPEPLEAFLRDHQIAATLFNDGLLVLGADGAGLADTPGEPGRVGQNFADRDYFQATLARRESVVSMPLTGRVSGRPLLVITAPVTDSLGQVSAVLAGITHLDTENFIGRMVGTYDGGRGGVLIIDPKSGRFVTATDASRILQPIPAPGVNPMHDRYMAGYEGSGIAVNSRGVEELSSSRRIAVVGWFAVVVLPTSEAFAPVAALQRAILGVALLLSLTVPLLVVPVTRRWLGPLRKTTSALRDMTMGRRELAALPVTTRDEVGELIESFNQLQARIRENEHLLRDHRSRLETALDTARMRFVEWEMTAEEPVAGPLLDLVDREDRGRVAAIVERDIAAHGRFLVEFRGADSEVAIWFMARGQIVDRAAASRQATAIVWDITEFKSAEIALYENEERFEAIIDSLNDAVLLHDGQTGEILYANARASEMYGHGPSAFRHLTFDDLVADDEAIQRETQDRFARALAGEPQYFECRARDAGGRLFWIETSVRSASIGNNRQLVVVVRDIDDRKQAEDALRRSEERYRALVDLSPDAIFVHRDGIMVMANRSALRLFGAEREEQLLGLPWTARVHPAFHQAVRQRLQDIQGTAGPVVLPAMEQRYLRVSGSAVDVEVTASSILLTEGRAVLSIARDISRRKNDQAHLKILVAQQEALLDNALVGIVLLKQRVITQCNRRFEELFGYGEGEMFGYTTRILYPAEEDYQGIGERAYRALARNEIYLEELWLKRKNGDLFWGCLHGRALDSSQPHDGSVWIYTDLTEQRRAQEHLRLAASVFENAAEGIMITDANRTILAVNQAFTETTGYAGEEVLGQNPKLLGSGRQNAAFYEQMWETIQQRGKWRGELWNRRKDGEIYPELLSISAVKDVEGHTTHYVGVFSDIAPQKRYEEQLTFLAHHDALTGLPNRTLFNDRLAHGIERAARGNARLAVLFIDLDRFKEINDTLGHPLGDQLLRDAARKLLQAIRACDTLARLGGDEFTLLIEDINDTSDALVIARKLLDIFEQPFMLAEHELYISASIGISFYPTDGWDPHDLIKNADAAMYQAKAKGRNSCHCYAREMTAYAIERLQLEAMLRRSIQRQELVVYFQPQVDLISGALIGAEALVRWDHPELGLIFPARFIPLAEETGFIAAIGEWVLRDACSKLRAWRMADYPLPRIAVNLSIKQFERGDMVDLVQGILAEVELPPECLEMEITESFIAKAGEAVRFARELRALGVHLSVDDFGTGYSSLMYLKQLPLQTLKIDRSFVADIGRDANNEAIVRTIIALARNLGLAVIAEGVETAEQVDFLLREGCRYGQGYYFSKPLPEQEFVERWLARQNEVKSVAMRS